MNQNSLKILIVDDVDENIKLAAKILKDNGYNISYARSGKETLEKISKTAFDLILLDIMMPEMDGYETAEKIKQVAAYKDVPIIFVTAKDEIDDIVKAFSAGGVDYITKPYNSKEMLVRVATHLDLYTTKKELKENILVKDKMMSIISHDLLGPLGTIKMSFDMYLAGELKYVQEHLEEFLGNIQSSLDSSYSMMVNVLEWARNINNLDKIKIEKIDIKNEISKISKVFIDKLKQKNINYFVDINTDKAICYDIDIFKIIIRNLISNAIKFTPNNGEIKIYLEEINNKTFVCIADTGIGMSPEITEKLLQRNSFYTSNGLNNEKGHGLGLNIVKDFISILDGDFIIESETGKGSVFKFSVLKNNS